MSKEAKPCPFCGSNASVSPTGLTCCSNVDCIVDYLDEWNVRPIEDQQAAEITAKDARIAEIEIERNTAIRDAVKLSDACKKKDVEIDSLRELWTAASEDVVNGVEILNRKDTEIIDLKAELVKTKKTISELETTIEALMTLDTEREEE